ncbi:MAG: hypothetical protein JO316_08840 [Abitibacteriaceae bacterium]|nr:hypothetical protein [Abditibacteriaceae bacterium]
MIRIQWRDGVGLAIFISLITTLTLLPISPVNSLENPTTRQPTNPKLASGHPVSPATQNQVKSALIGNLWVPLLTGWSSKITSTGIEFHRQLQRAKADIIVNYFPAHGPHKFIVTSRQLFEAMNQNADTHSTVAQLYGEQGGNHYGAGSYGDYDPARWRKYPAYTVSLDHMTDEDMTKAKELIFTAGRKKYSVSYIVIGQIHNKQEASLYFQDDDKTKAAWNELLKRVHFKKQPKRKYSGSTRQCNRRLPVPLHPDYRRG